VIAHRQPNNIGVFEDGKETSKMRIMFYKTAWAPEYSGGKSAITSMMKESKEN